MSEREYSNLRTRGQTGNNPPSSSSPAQRNVVMYDPAGQSISQQSPQTQGISPSRSMSSPNGTVVPTDPLYPERRRSVHSFSMQSNQYYPKSQMTPPGVMVPGKEMNDVSSNGSVPGMVPSNVPAMNNPIPNPNMVPAINQGGSGATNMVPGTLQRKNSFEDGVGLNDSGDMASMRNDQGMQYMDKNRKRTRPSSGKTPPGPIPTNALPNEAYLNSQRNKVPPSQRRRASAYGIQTGGQPGYAPMDSQGNGQTQSTPPNHSSPSDVLPDSPSGQNKGNYNPS
jgi:hypothetical protein